MMNLLKNTKALLTVITFGSVVTTAATAQAITLKVEVDNLGPDGGVALTPVWVGFHDGSFDSYNGGLPSERGLEQIAEDGIADTIAQDFLDNLTYVQDGVGGIFDADQVGTRVDGSVGGSAITAGTSAMMTFEVTPDESNRWFSYVSMILPSNDYYVANGNPFAHDLMPLFEDPNATLSFTVGAAGTVNDAGTEVNDFDTSAGNALFGIPGGQPVPGVGADQGGVNANVSEPFANFLNRPDGFDTDFASLNFNDTTLYTDGGVAQFTISVVEDEPPVEETPVAVPESPTTVGLMAMAGLFFFGGFRRRHHSH
ncbi:MAG: spondin domain-containing protein [Crocosphaera sp.]